MQQVFGAILLAIGILIAGLSGLCSIMVLSGPGNFSGPDVVESLTIVLLIGGTPFAIGAGLAYLGYRLMKSERRN